MELAQCGRTCVVVDDKCSAGIWRGSGVPMKTGDKGNLEGQVACGPRQ